MKSLEISTSVRAEELKERIDTLIQILEEERETVEVINRGKVIGRFVPAEKPQQPDKQEADIFWANIQRLAEQVGTHVTGEVDAVNIVREGRREL